MPRLTIQDGKLLLRDGKPGTEASCCCGGGCCTCPNDWWQLRVNDVPVPMNANPYTAVAQVYNSPGDVCLFLNHDHNIGGVEIGEVDAYCAEGYTGTSICTGGEEFGPRVFTGNAFGCLQCQGGKLFAVVALAITSAGKGGWIPYTDYFTAYYEINPSGGCGGVLPTTVMDPPEGAVGTEGAPREDNGEVIKRAVARNCMSYFDDQQTVVKCADWDPETLVVTLTCFCEDSIVPLEFSSCIGSGATGTATIEGGSVTGVTLTDGGSGFARLGRVEPTVTASVSGGSGATLSVTLAEQSENLGSGCMPVPYWKVDSVSVTAGGTGYSDGIAVTFSAASGDTQITAAKAYAYVGFDEPANATVTVTSSGSGASLTPTWSTTTQPSPPIDRGGATSPPHCEKPPRDAYIVTGFIINNGGSGYSVDDAIDILFAQSVDGVVNDNGYFAVDAVDGNGAITAVRVDYGGTYGGAFTDALADVVVEACHGDAGHYYREDANEPPYVATVTVHPENASPSAGFGDTIVATVDDDPTSATFGKIISLSVTAGGSGFLGPCVYNPLP